MSNGAEDLQMLRLIKAFQKISDRDARRTVVLYVEEQVERLQREARKNSRERSASSSLIQCGV